MRYRNKCIVLISYISWIQTGCWRDLPTHPSPKLYTSFTSTGSPVIRPYLPPRSLLDEAKDLRNPGTRCLDRISICQTVKLTLNFSKENEHWYMSIVIFTLLFSFPLLLVLRNIAYLLLTEFEVCTVSYGPSFFPFDLCPKRKARGP